MKLPFTLPPVTLGGTIPIWEGSGFRIGGQKTSVLEYSSNLCGWTDELTTLHEESAGSNHFIDCASRHYVLEQLLKYMKGLSSVVLEVGCSSGFMLRLIREYLPDAVVMGSDVICGALKQLASCMPEVPLFQFDLANCPLPDNCVDVVILLNVLEHIDDDKAAVQQIYRILKPGGIAIIEVPAGPHLYDIYDKMLLHRRRYTLSGLLDLVHKTGFDVLKQSHLGFFVYPGFSMIKRKNKHLSLSDDSAIQEIVEKDIKNTGDSRLLKFLMQIELLLGRWISYPFGIRCLVTCTKAG